jgi:MFS family permease
MSAEADIAKTAPVLRPRGTVRLLVDPQFGTLVWGKFLSSTAYWMHTVVVSILVYAATYSALLVGAVVAAQLAPQLVLGSLSGAWVDRGHTVAQLIIGRMVIAVGSGALAVWLTVQSTGGPWLVAAALLCSLLCGIGFAIGGPALQAVVPSLVRDDELPVAMALNTAPLTVSAIAGPSIGAYAGAHLGPAPTLAIAAGTHLVFGVAILVARLPSQRPHADHTDFSMRVALRYVWRDRVLLALLIGIAGIGFGAETSVTLAPSMTAELGQPAQMVGMITGCFGGGAAVGLVVFGPLSRWISTAKLASAGVVVIVVGLLVVGTVPMLAAALAGFAVAGFGYSVALSTFSALVQDRAPDHLRGRIMALWLMAMLGARPLAAALEGLLADLASVRTAVLASIAVLIGVAAITWPSRLTRTRAPVSPSSKRTVP